MNERTKIVIIINELLRGGAQRIVSDLTRSIERERFAVTVVHLKSHKNFGEGAATVEDELRRAGVRVVSMEGGSRASFSELRRLVRFLHAEKPDIVHTFLPYAGVMGRVAARAARVPRIISTQCNVHVAYDLKGYWIDRLTLPLANAWTATAEGIELEYGGSVAPFSHEEWQKSRRHFTIPAGVDLPSFDARVRTTDRLTKRREIGIAPDVPLVMMVARLISWKGPVDLVAAMSFLPENVHLALVGWGPLEKALKEQAREGGCVERVHFLGARNDVPELFATADVYVQAHNYSPDGYVWKGPNTSQMEACAALVPSVSTSVPLIESLIEDGVTGKLAAPNDPHDLAHAITYLLDHREEASIFAHAARARVEEHFSVAAMVAWYEGLYECVMR